ncbi:hypothetical protein [Streptomyces mobaraensis]|uniref:Uncharacterized protein n=1 Tax=Streptomyces mobaraensis TaxID=35621 RepID=A0A5N5W1S7_STRMB|nr:hypothetical protein [Streptomyces mobaraensis]KAB7835720.1 hypothetical protein FRZ00_26215 [Streptomyces mobaraensis]
MGYLLTGRYADNNRIVVTGGEPAPDDYEWDDEKFPEAFFGMHYSTTDDHEEAVRFLYQDKAEGMRDMPGISDEVYGTEMDNEEYEMAQNWTLGGEIDIEDCDVLRLNLTTADMPEDEIKQYVDDQPGHRSWCDTFEAPKLSDAIKTLFETYGDIDRVVTPAGKVFERAEPVSV